MDVGVGTFFSNLVMFFIILTTALTLHRAGITDLQSSRQAALALRPLAGSLAAGLYAAGLIGVGLLAIPTLAGSAAYSLAETFGWKQGLDRSLRTAPRFYVVVVVAMLGGIGLDFTKVNPLRALYWSAVLNGLLAPLLLVGILAVASDQRLMEGQPSSWLSRVTVAVATLLMLGAGVAMFAL
jgi:Mn2+/Fe2+ NRAMP family transporter